MNPTIYVVWVRFESGKFEDYLLFIDLDKLTALTDEAFKRAVLVAASHPKKAAVLASGLARTGTVGVMREARVQPPCHVLDAVTLWVRDTRPL